MWIIDIVGKVMKNSIFFVTTLFVFILAPLHASANEPPPDPIALYHDVIATIAASDSFSVHIEKQFDVVMLDGAKVQNGGANADLQIWMTTDDEPLLKKLVVTFWQIEGEPQQALVFSDWDLVHVRAASS